MALFWRGACECWPQINACAESVGSRLVYDTNDGHVDAVMQWWLADFAKTNHAFVEQPDWSSVRTGSLCQHIRSQLQAFCKHHGRSTTTSMLFAALAREIRKISQQLS